MNTPWVLVSFDVEDPVLLADDCVPVRDLGVRKDPRALPVAVDQAALRSEQFLGGRPELEGIGARDFQDEILW